MEIKENDSRSKLTIVEVDQLVMVENICETILRYPAKEYKVYDIAKGFSYSPDHFSRIFNKFKKVTVQEFIISTRIDYAKALLCNSKYPVTKIAELTGYKDIFHFSKQFAEKTGLSPSAYRKSE